MNVVDIMSKSVLTVHPEKHVGEAAAAMVRNDHGMLVVVDSLDESKLLGVVTDRDILEKVTTKARTPESVTVGEIMSKSIITVAPNETVTEAARIMQERNIKRLPVVHAGKLVGVISSTDILKNFLATKKDLLDVALKF